MTFEININCDLGEKSKLHSNKNDPELLKIVNSANVACGYHAGDEQTMTEVIEISKRNGVSIGAHPSFNDPENFGRERINLSSTEIGTLSTTDSNSSDTFTYSLSGTDADNFLISGSTFLVLIAKSLLLGAI